MRSVSFGVAWVTVSVLLSSLGCSGPSKSGPPELYDDLGGWTRPGVSSSTRAQAFFDQGLVLTFAFNHDEAIRCFEGALEADSDCAMAWWGIALANGPHINNPAVTPARAKAAWEALQRAVALKESTPGAANRALIEALEKRYSAEPPEDRRPLDEAYAAAMEAVWRAHPADPDVGHLTAEALMDLQPWDLWTPTGELKGRTADILTILERVLVMAPDHPGANHLYIHAVEASNEPARGLASAKRLGKLVPGAGHLVHMPAHIYLRVGDYAAAISANRDAIVADRKHASRFPRDGFYRLYMAHNPHFLSFAAMLLGNRQTALAAAREVIEGMPPEALAEMGPILDGFLGTVLHVLVRFGEWEQVLREAPPPPQMLASEVIYRYARTVALTALDRADEAEKELQLLEEALAKVDDRAIGNNPARKVLEVPRRLARGELLFRAGQREEGLQQLRQAIAAEDALAYDEPPDWMMPARHPLAAALLADGKWDEAEKVLKEDLVRFPENGWSLVGLVQVCLGRGDALGAAAAEKRFQNAWKGADIVVRTPCLCQELKEHGAGP